MSTGLFPLGLRAAARAFRALGVLACALACIAIAPASARAQLPITVTMTSDTALTLDSNSPTTSGPHAMYVAFRLTNTSGAPVSDLTATISGFGGGIVLSGGQVASQYAGTLAAGQSRTMYWFITYPSTFDVRRVLTVSLVSSTGGTATGTGAVRTMAMLSAAAGGATSSSTIGPGAIVGQMIPLDVTFTFKGWKAGDTFNLQPAGNPSFPASCFQLTRTEIRAADTPLNVVMPVGTVDRQYFVAGSPSSGGGSSWNVTIRYEYRYLCEGASATPLPYSNMLSGTQLKYNSDYGDGGGDPGPIPPAPNPSFSFNISKTVSSAQLPSAGSVTYTVAIQNISTFAATIDSIVDVLPSGATYTGIATGSDVTAANSGAVPASGATGRIVFRGNAGLSYAVAAGATLNLRYTVAFPATPGEFVNNAQPYVGLTQLGSASVTVTVGTADVIVTKTGPATIAPQDTIVYVIRLQNTGPAPAYRVVSSDVLPATVTYISSSRGATLASGVLTWPSITSISSGASVYDTVRVSAPAALGSVSNVARATSTSYDPNLANNDGTNAASIAAVTVVSPVVVTPDGLVTPVKRLPGTRYSQAFVVENIGGVSGSYGVRLTATGASGVLVIDSLTGPGITARPRADTAQITVAARTANTYQYWYTVTTGDTALAVARLRARHATQATYADTGWAEIRRAYPNIAMTKSVAAAGAVVPGVELTYTIRFTNSGDYDANNVVLREEVPVQADFKLGTPTDVLPGGLTSTLSYSNDNGATWAYVPVSEGCGAPVGFDACVNRLQWAISGVLPPGSPEGVLTYVARLR